MRVELASSLVSTCSAGSKCKGQDKASELQNRASSVGACCVFFSFTQQVGGKPETSGSQFVLLARLTLITGVWREGWGRGRKTTRAPGVGLRDNCVYERKCVFCRLQWVRASAHAMDLLQTVTTGKTLGRVLNSEQFFRARVSQQSAGSSLPLLSLSLSLTSSFAPPPPSSHPATLSLLFSCKCYALSLCLSEPQAHTYTKLNNPTSSLPPSYLGPLPLLLAVVADWQCWFTPGLAAFQLMWHEPQGRVWTAINKVSNRLLSFHSPTLIYQSKVQKKEI